MILHGYGCSWTEGEGCDYEIEKTLKNEELNLFRNSHSWVKLVADKLNLDCINNGISGNSNYAIFNGVIDDVTIGKVKEGDLVVVMWSSSLRDSVTFLPKKEWVSWSVKHLINLPHKFVNSYKSDNNKYDNFLSDYKTFFLSMMFNQNYYNIVNQNYIIFLQKLFKEYGVKYLMIDAFDKMVHNLQPSDDITHLINKKNYWQFDKLSIRDFLIKTQTNCFETLQTIDENPAQHPNSLGYNLISEEIYNYIIKNNIL
jgi:hypothetical protein